MTTIGDLTLNDIGQQNLVNRYRHRLDDIREWKHQLSDIMLTISGYSMDLTGIRGTTTRIPGGDALAMLGPWAPDAEHGDDLPHPDQMLREWAQTLDGPSHAGWTEIWRWTRDHVPTILESPWADDWTTDINTLWGRLAALTGNNPDHDTETIQRRLADHGALLPDNARLTLAQAEECWPGIRNRIDVDRSRERTQARKEHRQPQYRCNHDQKRRYLVADLRQHYGATRANEPADNTAKAM